MDKKNTLLGKTLIVVVIYIFIISCVPIIPGEATSSPISIESNHIDGDLADNIEMRCDGPYIVDLISRSDVFHIRIINNNDMEIYHKFSITVTERDGTIIFEELNVVWPHPMKPDTMDFWSIYTFKDFRRVGYMFGLFDLHVEFQVLNDGSKVEKTFHGIIFGLGAKIFYLWNLMDNR